MPDEPLERFRPPANCLDFLSSLGRQEAFNDQWSRSLDGWIEPRVGPNFYNPLRTATGDADRVMVAWTCFPKPIEDRNDLSADDKFRLADTRSNQSEYCEWVVERSASTDRILKVTFTTELVEYWEAMWAFDADRVVELYQELVDPRVRRADLEFVGGGYDPRNRWNTGGVGGTGAVHMIVESPANTLRAAVGVVAGAANAADRPPTGGAFHADELIALATTRAVRRLGARISFTDPVGVYLQEPEFHRIELPASAPIDVTAADFWTVTRGGRPDGCAMRAEFAVPPALGFTVGDLKIDGAPVRWGSQLARALKSSTYVTPIPRS